MNILPKKRWHVRTKENIARVRKDEAEAAEKERQERLRTDNADREARLSILKLKSKQRLESSITDFAQKEPSTRDDSEHINLFENLDQAVKTTNKEHDVEVKEKKEEYEKKIGYLTYLGQDTNEALKKKNWYEVLPEASRFQRSSEIKDTYDKLVLKDHEGKPKTKESDERNGEVAWKLKQAHDPINAFKSYCHKKKFDVKTLNTEELIAPKVTDNKNKRHEMCRSKKHKHKKDKTEKELKIQKLREARLKREQQERLRTQAFLLGQHESTQSSESNDKTKNKLTAKYNSQFNPELARQNFK